MKRSILTIGLGFLLFSVGFSQTTEKETTSTNSQTATPNPREVKIKKSVKVEKPTTTVSMKSNAVRKAETEVVSPEGKKEEADK